MSAAQPKELISCYDDLGFEQHEWGKHGVCAGVKDAKDFFTQVCALSAAPLRVMAATVAAGVEPKPEHRRDGSPAAPQQAAPVSRRR